MFKSFKKSLVTLLIAVTLTSGVAIPRNGQAGSAMLFSGYGVPIGVGCIAASVVVLAGLKAGGAMGGAGACSHREMIGWGLFGMFLVVFDAENPNGLSLKKLTSEAVTKLGIEEAQALIYNSEVDEINAIGESVVNQLTIEKFETNEAVVSRAKELWSSHSQNLSPETIAVIDKIASLLMDSAK